MACARRAHGVRAACAPMPVPRMHVQVREFRAILNKLTPEKLEALLIEALRLRLAGRDELEEVTQTVFSVAMAQPHFASVYAHFATNYHAFFPAQVHTLLCSPLLCSTHATYFATHRHASSPAPGGLETKDSSLTYLLTLTYLLCRHAPLLTLL